MSHNAQVTRKEVEFVLYRLITIMWGSNLADLDKNKVLQVTAFGRIQEDAGNGIKWQGGHFKMIM